MNHAFPTGLAALLALLLPLAAQGQAKVRVEVEDEPPPRMRDPAQALPSRSTGEAVMGSRDAFDRDSPQFQIGRRARSDLDAATARGAQLVGNDQTLRHECEIGERIELAGSNNIVTISGQCVGLAISGDNNTIEIDVVDEIRVRGERNDVRWRRGFTVERPNMLETGGRNSVVQAKAEPAS